MSVTDDIRQACAVVAEKATRVRINRPAIAAYARSLPLADIQAQAVDWSRHFRGDDQATAAYFVTLDTINFGSGYFPHLRKREGMSGYFTVATSLKDEFERRGTMSAQRLGQITAADCAAIFSQDLENPQAMELMALFAAALSDLGRLLAAKYRGQCANLIATADHSAERLIDLLAEMPFFCDVASYQGMAVPFYKRAQLTSADLSMGLEGRGLGRFDDLQRLTIFADNLVPHVLRIDGILEYDAELARRIDAEELIVAGSSEEVEIRACSLHAVELMKEATAAPAMRLDYVLWNRGQGKYYKTIKPRHRARSVYY